MELKMTKQDQDSLSDKKILDEVFEMYSTDLTEKKLDKFHTLVDALNETPNIMKILKAKGENAKHYIYKIGKKIEELLIDLENNPHKIEKFVNNIKQLEKCPNILDLKIIGFQDDSLIKFHELQNREFNFKAMDQLEKSPNILKEINGFFGTNKNILQIETLQNFWDKSSSPELIEIFENNKDLLKLLGAKDASKYTAINPSNFKEQKKCLTNFLKLENVIKKYTDGYSDGNYRIQLTKMLDIILSENNPQGDDKIKNNSEALNKYPKLIETLNIDYINGIYQKSEVERINAMGNAGNFLKAIERNNETIREVVVNHEQHRYVYDVKLALNHSPEVITAINNADKLLALPCSQTNEPFYTTEFDNKIPVHDHISFVNNSQKFIELVTNNDFPNSFAITLINKKDLEALKELEKSDNILNVFTQIKDSKNQMDFLRELTTNYKTEDLQKLNELDKILKKIDDKSIQETGFLSILRDNKKYSILKTINNSDKLSEKLTLEQIIDIAQNCKNTDNIKQLSEHENFKFLNGAAITSILTKCENLNTFNKLETNGDILGSFNDEDKGRVMALLAKLPSEQIDNLESFCYIHKNSKKLEKLDNSTKGYIIKEFAAGNIGIQFTVKSCIQLNLVKTNPPPRG
jgi:hypothetical protein